MVTTGGSVRDGGEAQEGVGRYVAAEGRVAVWRVFERECGLNDQRPPVA